MLSERQKEDLVFNILINLKNGASLNMSDETFEWLQKYLKESIW